MGDPFFPALERRGARLLVLMTLAVLTAAVVLPIGAEGSVQRRTSRDLATDVCDDMVGDATIATAGEALTTPQQGIWTGQRYVCRYEFRDGALVVQVDVLRTKSEAKKTYAARKKSAAVLNILHRLGQQAIQTQVGAIIAQKDKFILTVDPVGLPLRFDRDAITAATARAIFDCW